MMVQYDCGCYAILAGSLPVVVQACDGDSVHTLSFQQRSNMGGKVYSEVSDAEADRIIDAIGWLVADGSRWRDLRSLLASPAPPDRV